MYSGTITKSIEQQTLECLLRIEKLLQDAVIIPASKQDSPITVPLNAPRKNNNKNK